MAELSHNAPPIHQWLGEGALKKTFQQRPLPHSISVIPECKVLIPVV